MSNPGVITADSVAGRVLLALRAGTTSNGELSGRVPDYTRFMGMLVRAGYVLRSENGWQLTDAGRAACPLRNPAAATITPPATAPLKRSPAPVGLPAKTAPQTHVHRPVKTIHRGGIRMPNPARTSNPTAVDQVRRLLIDAPDGLARKVLIKRTGLADHAIDNAIVNLIKLGEAVRKGYGVIAAVPARAEVTAARVAQSAAIAAAAPAEVPAPVVLPSPRIAVKDAATQLPAAAAPSAAIDFAIYDDGRLAITDGDELFVLPPDATRRLCMFLDKVAVFPWMSSPVLSAQSLQPAA